MAKVKWHPGELYPRVGSIVTNLSRPPENIVVFFNQRVSCEQYVRERRNGVKQACLSHRSYAADAVRLQLHTLAYNLGNLLGTLAAPESIRDWPLSNLKGKPTKSARRSSATAAKLPSRWPRSQSRDSHSPTSCASSPDCDGRRLIEKQHEWPGCYAFQRKPRESYAFKRTKSTFAASTLKEP
ncbi:MAG: transposase [Alphaproteobacteria bacterium]|nr:transposase [Alphaproteobacteria bacterium]